MKELWKTLRWFARHPLWFVMPKFLYDNQMFVPLEQKKRAREIQKKTGWAYTECLKYAEEGMSDAGIDALVNIRKDFARTGRTSCDPKKT